jgi:hypothetical protein
MVVERRQRVITTDDQHVNTLYADRDMIQVLTRTMKGGPIWFRLTSECSRKMSLGKYEAEYYGTSEADFGHTPGYCAWLNHPGFYVNQ